jgi:hypothetical protein
VRKEEAEEVRSLGSPPGLGMTDAALRRKKEESGFSGGTEREMQALAGTAN